MDTGENNGITRRQFLKGAGVAGGAAASSPLLALNLRTQDRSVPAPDAEAQPALGFQRPQQNQFRNLLELAGLWQFQLDPRNEGEQAGWANSLPSPRLIPAPASWNDLFDDVADYLAHAWYSRETCIPKTWEGQKVFLRIYSAVYAAKVWLNGEAIGEHMGGHLPFGFEITGKVRVGQSNRLAIRVENLQEADRTELFGFRQCCRGSQDICGAPRAYCCHDDDFSH
jgi:beta-glucuronidase